ncbi:MAG: hypothetical protein Unbinned1473contig1002_38 [Prokaryotic dsDNA virus sp.]|nr:MAG: hypothetical protein Unbinned1473contig1002_38 [Prokaryotic dsDNA virus sp.]|tara:strand:- start:2462 stop:2710 length:249 start_codon:yes stop_codon:yes gene_type:complete
MSEKEELEENVRVFIDLKAAGNAQGGHFFRNNLVEHINKLEESGVDKVVGIVYDETYNIELVTQPVAELENLDMLKGKKKTK